MRGLYTAAGSMLVNQVRLETVSNNLANMQAPGYKSSEAVSRAFPETLLYYREKSMPPRQKVAAGPMGLLAENVSVEAIYYLNAPGNLRLTEEPFDFAIRGEGFFALETPDGPRYTRDGHFHVNGEGFLVNAQGFAVLGERGRIFIGGQLPHLEGGRGLYGNGQFIDRLQVVSFDEDSPLQKDGFNLFRATGNNAPRQTEAAVVLQGYLEESNVDLSRQMTQLVKIRRSYEAAQKIAQAYDRILSKAANELGTLR